MDEPHGKLRLTYKKYRSVISLLYNLRLQFLPAFHNHDKDILDEASCLYFIEKGSCFDAVAGFALGDYCAKLDLKNHVLDMTFYPYIRDIKYSGAIKPMWAIFRKVFGLYSPGVLY